MKDRIVRCDAAGCREFVSDKEEGDVDGWVEIDIDCSDLIRLQNGGLSERQKGAAMMDETERRHKREEDGMRGIRHFCPDHQMAVLGHACRILSGVEL